MHLFCKASGSPSGPTQSLIQWVLGYLALVVEHPGYEADHSPQSNVEDKNECSCEGCALIACTGATSA